MSEKKYLYGAAVQGIQSFIFQTNKMKEIIGASELVEQICTEAFDEFEVNGERVIKAAGNIKFVFNNEEDCAKAVREFPRKVMSMAPGITFSQAVVTLADDYETKRNELEQKLHEARNRQMISQNIGLMGIMRSRQTGLPMIADSDDKDAGTLKKIECSKLAKKKLNYKIFRDKYNVEQPLPTIEHITGQNDWIAVVHVDGNGLGDIFRSFGSDIQNLRAFSQSLSEATIKSAQEAVRAVATSDVVPIVPIVIGGDDLTVIIRASIAVDFVRAYLKSFEAHTLELCGAKLSACGGIAFIKSSYPFYYGYELAETLCGKAKNKSGRKHSCLMFHKVQDSFIKDFEDIKERELTPAPGMTFLYGPYYLEGSAGKPSIDELIADVKALNKDEQGSAAKSHLRQWLTLMHKSDNVALQRLDRVMSQTSSFEYKNIIKRATESRLVGDEKAYEAYDMLSLSSVIYQKTK